MADEAGTVEGQTFRFLDSEGNTDSVTLNPAEKQVPKTAAERSLIGNRLSEILNRKPSESGYTEDDEELDIYLKEEDEVHNGKNFH